MGLGDVPQLLAGGRHPQYHGGPLALPRAPGLPQLGAGHRRDGGALGGQTVELHREAHLHPAGGGGGEHLSRAGAEAGAFCSLRTVQAAGDRDGPLDALDQLVFIQVEHGNPGIRREDQLLPLPALAHLSQGQPGVRNGAHHLPRLQQLPDGLGPYRLLVKAAKQLVLPLHLHEVAGAVQVLEDRHRTAAVHLGLGQQLQGNVQLPTVVGELVALDSGHLNLHLAVSLLSGVRHLDNLREGQGLMAGGQRAPRLLEQYVELHHSLENELGADELALGALRLDPEG